jgi:hypothetical protein
LLLYGKSAFFCGRAIRFIDPLPFGPPKGFLFTLNPFAIRGH